jgi:hypothetical protein
MGKRNPYECIVPGCTKQGSISALKQHFRDKHGDFDIAETTLKSLIENGAKVPMTATGSPRLGPGKPSTGGQKQFLYGLVCGMIIANLLWIATKIACRYGYVCPEIERLLG